MTRKVQALTHVNIAMGISLQIPGLYGSALNRPEHLKLDQQEGCAQAPEFPLRLVVPWGSTLQAKADRPIHAFPLSDPLAIADTPHAENSIGNPELLSHDTC